MSSVGNGCKRCGRIVPFCSFEGISNDFLFFFSIKNILESNARNFSHSFFGGVQELHFN